MRDNILIRMLCSIPVILALLYFLPFLGVCLIIFRYIVYYSDRRIVTPYYLISTGLIILLPKLLIVNYIKWIL